MQDKKREQLKAKAEAKFEAFIGEAKYLPKFMQDNQFCADIFKRIDEMVKVTNPREGNIPWHIAMEYTVNFFLCFMAAHGYVLRKTNKKLKFYDITATMQNYRERMEDKKDIPESTFYETFEYKDYMEKGNYFPPCMKDRHDNKNIFKRIDEMVEVSESLKGKVNWCDAYCYIGDMFLYFMAAHGYTLQKSNRTIHFYDLKVTMADWKKRNDEKYAKLHLGIG